MPPNDENTIKRYNRCFRDIESGTVSEFMGAIAFLVYENGRPAKEWPLRNAYMLGADNTAIRAEIYFDEEDSMIVCQKREMGAAAIAIQHPAGDCGQLTVQTCLLPEREEPYLLSLELARHRMMILYNKLEEWTMFEYWERHTGEDNPGAVRMEKAKALFMQALSCHEEDPVRADRLAVECLASAIDASEELAVIHSELELEERRRLGKIASHPVGCGVCVEQNDAPIRAGIVASFDYIHLPLNWSILTPEEGEYDWSLTTDWVDWAINNKVPVLAGPLINFEPKAIPKWLYIWEHDFDTVRDLVSEHIETVVSHYKKSINVWSVVSGLHVNSHFTFNFDQLMDLTRLSVGLVKKLQPTGKVLIEIRQPFGEYYGMNQRSIPPQMYVDLLMQAGIDFDGFVMKMPMGQARPGQYARDLMQVSHLLDQYAVYEKPVHLKVAVPSEPVTQPELMVGEKAEDIDPDCGYWRQMWSPLVQSHWLEAIFQVAMSKAHVESVAWHQLTDRKGCDLPHGGLIDSELKTKSAFRRLVYFRRSLKMR